MLDNPLLPLSPCLSLSPFLSLSVSLSLSLSLSVFPLSPLPQLGNGVHHWDLGHRLGVAHPWPSVADLHHRRGGSDVVPTLVELDRSAGEDVLPDVGLACRLDKRIRVGGSGPLKDVGDGHDTLMRPRRLGGERVAIPPLVL